MPFSSSALLDGFGFTERKQTLTAACPHTESVSYFSAGSRANKTCVTHVHPVFLMRRKFFTIKIVAIYSRLLVEFE